MAIRGVMVGETDAGGDEAGVLVTLLPQGVTVVRYSRAAGASAAEVVIRLLDDIGARLDAATATLAALRTLADLLFGLVAVVLLGAATLSGGTAREQALHLLAAGACGAMAAVLRGPVLRWFVRRALGKVNA